MKKLLASLLIAALAMTTGVMAAPSMSDGAITDWTNTFADPAGDRTVDATGGGNLTTWGAESDGTYIYGLFVDARIGSAANFFSALHIDVDRVGGATSYGTLPNGGRAGWNGPSLLGGDFDQYPQEFRSPYGSSSTTARGAFDGQDVVVELGYGAAGEGFNFWGQNDDTWTQGSAVYGTSYGYTMNQDVAVGSDYCEYRVPVSAVVAEAALSTDNVTPKKVWKVAARHALNITSSWGADASGDGTTDSSAATNFATNRVWTYVPALTVMGDVDENLTVGLSDLNILKTNWQSTVNIYDDGWAVGDVDGDLTVGLSDLNLIKGNWQSSYSGGGAVTPEPATLGLLALGLLGLLRRR